MIKFFEFKSGYIKETAMMEKSNWISVVKPLNEELSKISDMTNISMEYFMDTLDINERSRIEIDDNLLFILLRIPVENKEENNRIPFITIPVGIIVKENWLITICMKENKIIEDFMTNAVKNVTNKNTFILRLFLRTSIRYLDFLKIINMRTTEVENELHKSMRNKELINLLNIEKSLVYFTTSLRANEIMMERLLRGNGLTITEEEKELLEDVIVENKQAIEMSNIYSDILSGMMDAFASVISNNLNVVMKTLTSLTIILNLPIMVSSVFGMNVPLPFQNSKHAFLFVMILSIIFSIAGTIFFIKRKWF